ncbi:hypothetical protein H0H93_010287 [Arthromyces matolae]|nr:hypothetical protein H0H93_010287 [Arthromyces matolae]
MLVQEVGKLDDKRYLMPEVFVKKESVDREAWDSSIYKTLVETHAKKVVDILGDKPFILALDECSELGLVQADSDPRYHMSSAALRRIIKAGEDLDIWYVFLDTNEHIIPPTGNSAPPSRLRHNYSPLPPFPYLEYDVMMEEMPIPETPNEALNFKSLQCFGRPYWHALPSKDALSSATPKLLGAETFKFNVKSDAQVFAVFSARLVIELGSSEASTKLAIKGLRSHMRILKSVTSHNSVITCAPSEPMLAVTAAVLLTRSDDIYKNALKRLVDEILLKENIIERGRLGELLARILLMMARDYALPMSSTSPLQREFVVNGISNPSVQVVRLDAYLQALLGENIALDSNALPDIQRHRQNLLSWAHSHFVNFTHFMQIQENIYELSPKFLKYCWCRGIALACAFGQPVFDILIVTYSGDLNEPFDLTKFGLVVIQVNLRAGAANRGPVGAVTCPPLKNKREAAWKPEHLVISMDVGATAPFDSSNLQKCNIGYQAASPPKPKTKATAARKSKGDAKTPTVSPKPKNKWQTYYIAQEPLRYFIEVSGHSAEQYPLIANTNLDEAFNMVPTLAASQFRSISESMDQSLHRLSFDDTVTTIRNLITVTSR